MSVSTRCNEEVKVLGKQIHLRYMQTTQQKDPNMTPTIQFNTLPNIQCQRDGPCDTFPHR